MNLKNKPSIIHKTDCRTSDIFICEDGQTPIDDLLFVSCKTCKATSRAKWMEVKEGEDDRS